MSDKIKCPNCDSKYVTKKGTRKNRLQKIQLYKCKSCSKTFTQSINELKNKTYTPKIILNSISYYNLGYTQQQTSKIIARKHKISVPQKTLSNWINNYKNICTYYRLREKAKQIYYPEFLIFSKKFYHEQVYNFQMHNAKLDLLFEDTEFSKHKKFLPVKDYLKRVPTESFPHHIFGPKKEEGLGAEQRASQMKLGLLPVVKLSKNNLANKLAGLALQLAKTNKERHERIQEFMLVNDSTTIAVEAPVYLTHDDIEYFKERKFTLDFENYKTPITGHIDILQIRNNLIHILDYKPEAEKEKKAVKQLTIYALALASRTKLPVNYFKCAWFDEKSYFEFFPLHCVYNKKTNQNF
ncbi:MAG: PD-(D/E)XK nuclease family protein [Nanoarchaeota archaeon]|nr:PD-(D/E)XK nuclease family protein [Nanoarchaeota archaeon]